MLSAIRSHFHLISFCNLIGDALAEPLEVNSLNPPMLLGSFLPRAERGMSRGGDEASDSPGATALRAGKPPSRKAAPLRGSLSSPMAQLHVVTSQFVMFISCALRARIEYGTGSRHVARRSTSPLHLQLAIVLRVVVFL